MQIRCYWSTNVHVKTKWWSDLFTYGLPWLQPCNTERHYCVKRKKTALKVEWEKFSRARTLYSTPQQLLELCKQWSHKSCLTNFLLSSNMNAHNSFLNRVEISTHIVERLSTQKKLTDEIMIPSHLTLSPKKKVRNCKCLLQPILH